MYFEYEDGLIDYCMQMAMFMKGILWMVNLWVKLRMLIYDVFGIGKSSAYGGELFLFCGGGVWLCDPVGVGG